MINPSYKQPRVSAVIPTFNRGDLLCHAIDSVLDQTYPALEIIVVDDGSTDDTSTRIVPYLDRIQYHAQPNRGVGAARNTGIQLAQGEFVAFLDSDDVWLPEKISQQVQFADAHPEYALIASEISGFDQHGAVPTRSKAAMYRVHNGHVLEHLLFANWIQTSTVLARRDALLAVGGFDETVGQFGEDWLLWMQIAARHPIYFLPQPLVRYRIHHASLTAHAPEKQYISLMNVIAKLRELPQFRRDPRLLRRAEYRIVVGRARGNIRAGDYQRALQKLKYAIGLQPVALRARYFWLMANLRMKLASASES